MPDTPQTTYTDSLNQDPVDYSTQLQQTQPDYVVYIPNHHTDISDTGNEHFLVFDGPDNRLMAVWTQSTRECNLPEYDPDQHIAFATSDDEGKSWSQPRILAGPAKPGDELMASWAFPMVSRSGRIYVLYNQHIGKYDTYFHHAGYLDGIYSDDAGATWSKPQRIELARSIYDNPDTSIPQEIIVWQRPDRLTSDGKYLVGLTRWVSKEVRYPPPINSWIAVESVVEFLRFDNLDDDPEPGDLKVTHTAKDKDAVRSPYPGHPDLSVTQEPSLVKLPDGRLLCVMRTSAGSPYWTVSADDGVTWSPTQVLREHDGGEPLKHPLSPCPIYDLGGVAAGSGTYMLLIHNHDGHQGKWKPTDTSHHRRPIYKVIGRFDPDATNQPIRFDPPEVFMDHDGVALGPESNPRTDLAMYASSTVRNGQPVLWYPDRKYFLLGRKITRS